MGMIEDVYDFQTKILGNDFPDKRKMIVNEEGAEPRKGFKDQTIIRLTEEVNEFIEADKLSDQADALVDGIYFALGALHQAGVDTQRVWDAVHTANMSKVKGVTKRGDDNDAAKPTEWKAPDHTWLDDAEAA